MGIENLKDQIIRLNLIGIALTSEHDLDKLMSLIVREAREYTNCDAGSLYIKEDNKLIFMVSQNDTLARRTGIEDEQAMFKPFTVTLSKQSVAGYSAVTGEILNIDDAYEIPGDREYKINREFDRRNNYRTKSILTVPLLDHEKNVVGVLQLINALDDNRDIISFSSESEGLVHSLASQAAVAIKNAQLNESLKEAHYDTIFRLGVAAEYRDMDTAMHLRRMSNYAAVLARKLGFSKTDVELILNASPMHDVGKLGIPDAILLKPGKLTDDEFKIMESHTTIGAKILANADSEIMKHSELIAISHHEKFNGTGYPYQMAGEEIPLEGRICALADVFDALTSRRCYKPAFPMEKVLSIIDEGRGSHFDPAVIDAFISELDEILTIKEKFKDELGEVEPEKKEDTIN